MSATDSSKNQLLHPNPETQFSPQNNLFNQLELLKERPDIPYSNRPNIRWTDLVQDLEQLINAGSIFVAPHSTDVINYGIYKIDDDHQICTIVIPNNSNPEFGYDNSGAFANLAAEVYKIHHQHFDNPKRIQYLQLSSNKELTPVTIHTLYDHPRRYPDYALSEIPQYSHTFIPFEEFRIEPNSEWTSPIDLIDSTDPKEASQKYQSFIGSLTPYEKEKLFSDKDAAFTFISLVIGIKPASTKDSLDEFSHYSGILKKSGLRYINGTWINDQILAKTLSANGISFSPKGYEYLVNHLKSNQDNMVDLSLAFIRGIAYGYGRENAQPYADYESEAKGRFSSGSPTTSELAYLGLPPKDAEFASKYLQIENDQRNPESDNKIRELFTKHQVLSSTSTEYLLRKTLFFHLGEPFITIQSSDYRQKITQKTNKFLQEANIIS